MEKRSTEPWLAMFEEPAWQKASVVREIADFEEFTDTEKTTAAATHFIAPRYSAWNRAGILPPSGLPEWKKSCTEFLDMAAIVGAGIGLGASLGAARTVTCAAGGCGRPAKHHHGHNNCCGSPLHCAQILGLEQQSSSPAFGPTVADVLKGVP